MARDRIAPAGGGSVVIDAEPERSELSESRRAALRDAFRALLWSRILIWTTGIAVVAILGADHLGAISYNHHAYTTPFRGDSLNALFAPAARWDSTWYLGIAHAGYQQPEQTVFFPLYPALTAIGGTLLGGGTRADLVAGLVLSLSSALLAVYLLHRLTALELGQSVARNTVWIFCWLPVAFFLSTVYTEALFAALTIGSFYSARLGRWAMAGLIGALASATRNGGVLLILPLVLMYLYGPRADRPPDYEPSGPRPRYRLRRDVLWIAAVPAGLVAYLLYLKISMGHALTPFQQESNWQRYFAPLGAVLPGVWAGLQGIAALASDLVTRHGTDMRDIRNSVMFVFLPIAVALLWWSRRRLPLAYTAYAAAGLAIALSAPSTREPLKSLPRFTLVLFPLWIALGLWATQRRMVRQVVAICAPLLVAWTYMFVSWTWAA